LILTRKFVGNKLNMKTIILKTPAIVFFLGLVLGLLVRFGLKYSDSIYYDKIDFRLLYLVQLIVATLWLSSLVAYFSHEGKSKKKNSLIYSLIGVLFISTALSFYLEYFLVFALFTFLLNILLTILLVPKIKKVFYARSTWFIVIELLMIPVGILSLTPEIQRWEKSEKE
jgi:uncharacterized membrane protein